MIQDRPYQLDVIAQFDEASKTYRRILLVAPTGSGKTIIGSSIIKAYVARHQEVLVLAHRREIVFQTSKKLRDLGIWHGIVQAGVSPMPMAPVQVASIQTLDARAMRKGRNGMARMALPPAKLVVVDEAHHATARTWRNILNAYPDAIILGLTATPCRGDGNGLGTMFETMIECPQIPELIKGGYLVPSRVYAPSMPDLMGVKVKKLTGDYDEVQLAALMDKVKLVADIVATYHKHGEGCRAVCFASSVGHSIHLRDEFIASGVRAAHIDGKTPKAERDETLRQLAAGEITIVCNYGVLTEGWDMPEVGCCILARPTKKMGLYRQMGGRVLRPAPGKAYAIILDHSGAVFLHGLPEDTVLWTLDEGKTARNPTHEARKGEYGGPKLVECTQCSTLREGGKPCPNCGFLPVRKPQLVHVRDGDLALVENRKPGVAQIDKAAWHRMFAGYVEERGQKPGRAAHLFKEKFGHWPPYGQVEPMEPTPEVRAYVRSRDIAYAKSQGVRW